MKIHRVVLETFIGPQPPGQVSRHLNGNNTDNRIENLQYGTHHENNVDAVHHNTICGGRRRLSLEVAIEIRSLFATGNYSRAELARRYEVAWTTIGKVISGERWVG